MPTICYTPVTGYRVLVAQVDVCGNLLPNGLAVVTSGISTVKASSEIEEGAEITKTGFGGLCVQLKKPDQFKRRTLEFEMCDVNPSLISMMTNAKEYADYAGNAAGYTVGEGTIEKYFTYAMWTELSGADACAGGGGDPTYGLSVYPVVSAGVLGDEETTSEDAVTISITGAYTRAAGNYGTGFFNLVKNLTGDPAKIPMALTSKDHVLQMITTLPPPPVSCTPFLVVPA